MLTLDFWLSVGYLFTQIQPSFYLPTSLLSKKKSWNNNCKTATWLSAKEWFTAEFESGFRIYQSTEIVVVKVINIFLWPLTVDSSLQHLSLLTITLYYTDHCMQTSMQHWVESHLSNRLQFVHVNGDSSWHTKVTAGSKGNVFICFRG